MVYNLLVTSLADDDTEQALLHYGSINKSLGERFYDELQGVYEKLRHAPQHYSFMYSDGAQVRDAGLASFPYLVVFEVVGDTVIILSVLNTHMKPRKF